MPLRHIRPVISGRRSPGAQNENRGAHDVEHCSASTKLSLGLAPGVRLRTADLRTTTLPRVVAAPGTCPVCGAYLRDSNEWDHHRNVHRLKRLVALAYGSRIVEMDELERAKDAEPPQDAAPEEWDNYALNVLRALFVRSLLSWYVDEQACRLLNVHIPHPQWRDYLQGMLAGECDPRIPPAAWERLCAAHGASELPGLCGPIWMGPGAAR